MLIFTVPLIPFLLTTTDWSTTVPAVILTTTIESNIVASYMNFLFFLFELLSLFVYIILFIYNYSLRRRRIHFTLNEKYQVIVNLLYVEWFDLQSLFFNSITDR